MVMGGALPPQLINEDNIITSQWCAQAKKKVKKQTKKKSSRKTKTSKKSKVKKNKKKATATASPLANVPAIGQKATPAAAPMQSTNVLLSVNIPKGVSNQVLNYQSIRVNFNPSLRIPNCVAYELTATMVAMADAPDHESRKNYNYAKDPNAYP